MDMACAEKEVGVVCFNKNVTFVHIRLLFFKHATKKILDYGKIRRIN